MLPQTHLPTINKTSIKKKTRIPIVTVSSDERKTKKQIF
jgi:hypothetical protein